MTLLGSILLVTGWYGLGVTSRFIYEFGRNGFRYWQGQDVVRALFYGFGGPVTLVHDFFHMTMGREFQYVRRDAAEILGLKQRVWQNKEEKLKAILRAKRESEGGEVQEKSYAQMSAPSPVSPRGYAKSMKV